MDAYLKLSKNNILGGACTDYSCSCSADIPSDITDVTLDNRSTFGYIP